VLADLETHKREKVFDIQEKEKMGRRMSRQTKLPGRKEAR